MDSNNNNNASPLRVRDYVLEQRRGSKFTKIIFTGLGYFDALPEELKEYIFLYVAYEHGTVDGNIQDHPLNKLATISRSFRGAVEGLCGHLLKLNIDHSARVRPAPQVNSGAAQAVVAASQDSTAIAQDPATDFESRPTRRTFIKSLIAYYEAFPRGKRFTPCERQTWLHFMRSRCVFCIASLPTSAKAKTPTQIGSFNPRVVVCKTCDARQWPDPIGWDQAKQRYHLDDRHLLWPIVSLQKGRAQPSGTEGRANPPDPEKDGNARTLLLQSEVKRLAERIREEQNHYGHSYWD